MIEACTVCGSHKLLETKVLWPELIEAWGLDDLETEIIDRQQGLTCLRCGCSLRVMALAAAVTLATGFETFKEFVEEPHTQGFRMLEINTCGALSQYWVRPWRLLVEYPQVRMESIPIADETFSMVVHSDTLEHVEDMQGGLKECRRLLKPGGSCVFTVPMLPTRSTRSTRGLPPSYHGQAGAGQQDMRVHWEFGADVWRFAIEAGFARCEPFVLEYPAAVAWICRK